MIILKDIIHYGKENTYHKILTSVVNDKRISPLALKLLIILQNSNTKRFRPTIKSLAKQLNISERTVDRTVEELKQYGYLESSSNETIKNRINTIWNIHQIPIKK